MTEDSQATHPAVVIVESSLDIKCHKHKMPETQSLHLEDDCTEKQPQPKAEWLLKKKRKKLLFKATKILKVEFIDLSLQR